MTGWDLIVLAPWIVFGAAVAVVYGRLRRSRRREQRPPGHLPGQADRGRDGGPQREAHPPRRCQDGNASP